jgi:hypothetical protein
MEQSATEMRIRNVGGIALRGEIFSVVTCSGVKPVGT